MREIRNSSELGRAMRDARKTRSMTQEELALAVGTSRYSVMSMERGGPVNAWIVLRAVAVLGGRIVLAGKNEQVQAA